MVNLGNYLYAAVCLLLPLAVSALPLVVFSRLSHLEAVDQSAPPLLALSTAGSVLMGCLSSGLAVLLSAALLTHGMKGEGPKCVTGAVLYLMSGGFFTGLTLAIGLYMTAHRALHKQG